MRIRQIDYLNSMRCPKLTWIHRNNPRLIPSPCGNPTARQRERRCVEDLVRRRYPFGRFESGLDGTAAHYLTCVQTSEERPVFEASFENREARARADILAPADSSAWTLIKITSSTNVNPEHIHDLAYQQYVMAKRGIESRASGLAHINGNYVRRGGIELNELIEIEDVSDLVIEAAARTPQQIVKAFKMVRAKTCPEPGVGPQCTKSGDCPMIPVCWKDLPDHDSINLAGSLSRRLLLLDRWTNIDDVAEGPLRRTFGILQRARTQGCPQVKIGPIQDWVDALEYPICCLGFETVNPAIPLWNGKRRTLSAHPIQALLASLLSDAGRQSSSSILWPKAKATLGRPSWTCSGRSAKLGQSPTTPHPTVRC